MTNTGTISLLHPAAAAWMAANGWQGLRPVQEKAARPILAGDRDVVIAAGTAAGKTEAAFLPACSLLAAKPSRGVGLLYLSPLKALINDQHARLSSLCGALGLRATAWHGDIAPQEKETFLRAPSGLLLITPESLEGFLCRRGDWSGAALSDLRAVVIDEFHAFTGNERGRQLLSLLRRLDIMNRRSVPRVALSATLGSPEDAAAALRPHADGFPCELVTDGGEAREPVLELRGYSCRPPYLRGQANAPDPERARLVDDMFLALRGGDNLVFANSRARSEQLAGALRGRCLAAGVDNEFFPHHGSLAAPLREALERRLKEGGRPVTAVCTMTLELGVDIGGVDSIAQVCAPSSVSSLRQRLGRSGRRGSRPVLRLFIPERWQLDGGPVADRLRMELFQSVAMLGLLKRRWYEPVADCLPHYSTMVQQTLSLTAQYGGLKPSQIWNVLCGTGPFPVSQASCVTLLRGMVSRGLLAWNAEEKLMTLAETGEELVRKADFANAFRTPEAYAVTAGGRCLGSLPVTSPLEPGQRILLAGRAWAIEEIDGEQGRISVVPSGSGLPPRFQGQGQDVHTAVRQEMYRLYREGEAPAFCDGRARQLFREGQRAFAELDLARAPFVDRRSSVSILPWVGDRATRTITRLLRGRGLKASHHNGIIEVSGARAGDVGRQLTAIWAGGRPALRSLADALPAALAGKYDEWVDPALSASDAALRYFDLDTAWAWLERRVRRG